MQTFVVKLASGVAALIASVCLSVCNLSDDTTQTAVVEAVGSSVIGLRMTMAAVPVVGLIIAVIVFKRKYILTEEKIKEISQKLKQK